VSAAEASASVAMDDCALAASEIGFVVQEEIHMDKRTTKAAAVVLGAIVGLSMIDCRSASAQAVNGWGQVNIPAGKCDSPAINDAGTTVGDCNLYQGKGRVGFVQLLGASSPTQLASLASTANGVPCVLTALSNIPSGSNAQAGTEIITGRCDDANAVSQGVFWISGTPTTAPTQLMPLSPLGLGLAPDVQTKVNAVSPAGVMIGVSINSSGTKTPVTWSSTGAPTQLLAPALSSNANCEPLDINEASPPSILGNCKDAGTGGVTKSVVWLGTGSPYSVLPLPTGAKNCFAKVINYSGQVLGQCDFGNSVTRAVQWQSGGAAVTALMTLNGVPVSRSYAVDMNDDGNIACNYLTPSGVEAPCYWDPKHDGVLALPISLPTGSEGTALAVAIGGKNNVIGNYYQSGDSNNYRNFGWRPFYDTFDGVTAIADPGAGTGDTIVSSMSRGGVYEAAEWEQPLFTSRTYQDVVKVVPTQ
jgi:hypothetical protein